MKGWHVGLKGITGNHCLFKNTMQVFTRTGRNPRDGQQPSEYSNSGSSKYKSAAPMYTSICFCVCVCARACACCVHEYTILFRDALCIVSIQSLAAVLTFTCAIFCTYLLNSTLKSAFLAQFPTYMFHTWKSMFQL
jgi:hypothetical protein